jgi:hypothetical protein
MNFFLLEFNNINLYEINFFVVYNSFFNVKWIHHAEKTLRHSDYTEIITQIYESNNFLSNFEKMFPKNSSKKNNFVEHLEYDKL